MIIPKTKLRLLIVMTLLMASCTLNGFYQQKYTDLKPIASSEVTAFSENDPNDIGDDNDPIADLLSKGIDDNYIFIIHKDGKYYEIKGPRYDMFYYSLSGVAEEVQLADYGDTMRIEIELKPDQKMVAGKGKFYVSDMESAVFRDTPDEVEKNEEPAKEKIGIVTTKVEEEKVSDKNIEEDPKNQGTCADTLLLHTEKRVIVNVLDVNKERIRFSYCADSLNAIYERPTTSVKEIMYSDGRVEEIRRNEKEKKEPVFESAVYKKKYVFDHDPSHLSNGSSNCIDEMHLKSGQIIKVRVIQVTEKEVKYKKCDDVLGRKFVKQGKYISKIKYADGFEEEIHEPHMYIRASSGTEERSAGEKFARGIGFTLLGIFGFLVLVILIAILAF